MSNFSFQRLQVYQLAKEVLTLLVRNRALFRGLPGELLPQMERAATSVVLNIAEGAGRSAVGDQRRHYQIAAGSAAEVAACLDIAEVYNVAPEVVAAAMGRMARLAPMLGALIRSRR
jgi:four helix bundle protein